MGHNLNSCGDMSDFLLVNAFLWTTRLKLHYATLNQLEQEESAEAASRNSSCSQPSGTVELRLAVAFWKTCLKHTSV